MRKGPNARREPLVSVGVPVRNGQDSIAAALASLTAQTHSNLEIIISDNASTDDTGPRCQSVAASDPRIEYYRQPEPLTAFENFRFVYERSTGEYFMWAAHDDLRDPKYVEQLLRLLESSPDACLAFGELAIVYDDDPVDAALQVVYEMATGTRSYWQRLRRYSNGACVEIYGLWRRAALMHYHWPDLDHGPDIPLLVFAAVGQEFVQAEDGPVFYQRLTRRPKSGESRARQNSYAALRPLPYVRTAWVAAGAAVLGAALVRGNKRSRSAAFVTIFVTLRGGVWRTQLFNLAPPWLRRLWRRFKGIFGRPVNAGGGLLEIPQSRSSFRPND